MKLGEYYKGRQNGLHRLLRAYKTGQISPRILCNFHLYKNVHYLYENTLSQLIHFHLKPGFLKIKKKRLLNLMASK